MIRDFSKNITSIKAYSGKNVLGITKVDKSTWKIEPCTSELVIVYDVFALDLSVRSAHMDNTHAFFNGTSMFLNPLDLQVDKYSIEIKASEAHISTAWTVKTALLKQNVNAQGYGVYIASTYDELIDCPVEISDSVDAGFVVGDAQHHVHFTGDVPGNIDTGLIEKHLYAICKEHVAMFRDELPLDEYRFLTMVSQDAYGGLEHKSSTALLCSPADLPLKDKVRQSDDYLKFLGLCSHEYFHLWNVKRLKPFVLKQSDLSAEAHTELLWFFEGVTSYYDDLALLRSGVISLEQYLGLLAKTLTRYFRTLGRLKQNLLDSSFDAWTKFYKQDSNSINAIVSYYTKGALVALGLDITIRQKTAHLYSLDDLMRQLWNKYGLSESGIEERQIETEVELLTGENFSEFFDSCLRSTSELPLANWLAAVGIGINLRTEKNADDQGGYIESSVDAVQRENNSLTLGCKLQPGTNVIQYVLQNSPAEHAGLCPDDELLALNNRKVTAANLEKILNTLSPGHSGIAVHSFRRGVLYEASIVPEAQNNNTCDLYLLDKSGLSEEQQRMHYSWCSTSAN
jgi:predicted metalloprotease with PDZ domain